MEKQLDRATAMGSNICNTNDEMGWREEEHLCSNQEEIDGGGENVANGDNDGTTYWRCSYPNEEENIEDSSINNDSNMAGWNARFKTKNKAQANNKYNTELRNNQQQRSSEKQMYNLKEK